MTSSADSFGIVIFPAIALAALALTLRGLISALHALQQDDYSNLRFARWLRSSPTRPIQGRAALLYLAGAALCPILPAGGPVIAAALVSTLAVLVAVRSTPRAPHKKPLVYTGRARRLLVGSAVVAALAFGAGYAVFVTAARAAGAGDAGAAATSVLLMSGVSVAVAPLEAMAANFCLWPIQAGINWSYRVRARRKLARLSPMVVGITGSYGKTSTKYFTEALMSSRFRVLKTRASFNTILGICRAVNEELGPEHEVLIVEMGAYRRGEIRDMVRLTRPRIGVLTAIGPQHLERFGSIETIEQAKFELLEALPADGIAVVNNDDLRVRRLADTLHGPRVRRYGIDNSAGPLDLAAESIEHGPDGLTFTMVDGDGKRVTVTTRLIGLHNVSNILAATMVAQAAGVSLRAIAGSIAGLQPVPHRLEVHTGADGVTIIDDAYNSNPVGALNALKALAEFKAGRRILVTPGMVELGVEQDMRNEELGTWAAAVCDYVILVGQHQTAAIRRGLDGAGFAADRVVSARNLTEGLEALRGIARAGDAVLFENDLPDLYEE